MIKLPESKCPQCGYVHDGAMNISDPRDALPKVGDLGICSNCSAFLTYGKGLMLHLASEEQMQEILKTQPGLFFKAHHGQRTMRIFNYDKRTGRGER